MRINLETQPAIRAPRDDMIDTLIAISVVAKRLAAKLIDERTEKHVKNERTVAGSR